ncbi:MAG: amylo-alpha-1,6-glucosidase [Syntrophobacteraceae bacterium]
MSPGLRSLAPGRLRYNAGCSGDLRSREEAYRQRAVWTWLSGPYADARPGRRVGRRCCAVG